MHKLLLGWADLANLRVALEQNKITNCIQILKTRGNVIPISFCIHKLLPYWASFERMNGHSHKRDNIKLQ